MRTSILAACLLSAFAGLVPAQRASAQPAVFCGVSGGGDVIEGETTDLVVVLENTGTTVGFVPGVLLPLPPGATVGAVTSTLLGATATTVSFNGSGNATHPITGEAITGPANGTAVFVAPGVNSLAPSAGPITLTIAIAADSPLVPYTAAPFSPACEFAYGADAENNVGSDPRIASVQAASVRPVLLDMTHEVFGKDGVPQTTTGPSWPVRWVVTLNAADGFTSASDFEFTVPDGFEVTAAEVTEGTATLGALPVGVGGTISGTIPSFTGAATASDIEIEIRGFVAQFDSLGADVLDPTTGLPVSLTGSASVSNVVPDVVGPVIADLDEDATLGAHALLIAESLAPSGDYCPGDSITVTVEACVSDYFSFGSAQLSTLIPDGTSYVSSTGTTTPMAGMVTTAFGALAAGSMSSVALTFDVLEAYASLDPVLGGDFFDFRHQMDGTGAANVTVAETVIGNPRARVKPPTLDKAIVAVNSAPYVAGDPIRPGDVVTFRLTTNFLSGDQASFVMTDYLPPKFDGTEHGSPGVLSAVGSVRLGPSHSAALPNVSAAASAADNAIAFSMAAFSVPSADAPLTFEVELDMTVNNTPVDNAFTIQNVAIASTGASSGLLPGAASEAITTGEPELRIWHGAIEVRDEDGASASGVFSGNTGPTIPATRADVLASQLTANVQNNNPALPDAGDTVQWRVILANIGDFPAHRARFSDAFAASALFDAPTIVSVTDGDGNALSAGVDYTDNTAAGEVFDFTLLNALPAANDSDGSGIVVVTFEAALSSLVDARHDNQSTATIDFYTSAPAAATNYATIHESEVTRNARSRDFIMEKVLVPGSPSELAIRDTTRFRVVWTIPEGTHNTLTLRDDLESGLAASGPVAVSTASGGVTFAGGTPTAVNAAGSQINLAVGTTTNSNRDSSVAETLTIEYEAVATNVSANNRGSTPANRARAIYRNNPPATSTRTATFTAREVTILEPTLAVSITPSITQARPGDSIDFDVSITHPAASNSDAFDSAFTFTLPAELEGLTQVTAPSLATSSNAVSATSASYSWDTIPDGTTVTFRLRAAVRGTVTPLDTSTLAPVVTWTSHPLDSLTPLVAGNAASVERTGAGGIDDYRATASANISIRDCLAASAATDCDDGSVCTVDACSAAGQCTNTPVTAGASCLAGMGVCTGAGGTPANTCEVCIDDNSGATDADSQCGASRQCDVSGGTGAHMCVTCLDTTAAAGQDDGCATATPVCDTSAAGGACVECTLNSHCAGGERCQANACVVATCNDGVVDVGEACDEGAANGPDGSCSDSCTFNIGNGPCDDTAQCAGAALCDAMGTCVRDSDGDGVEDTVDPDDDNDGILDVDEGQGVDPSLDADGDDILDFEDTDAPGFVDDNADGIDDRYDFDGDGVPNHLDLDSDNDGLSDTFEGGGPDVDGDGLLDGCMDDDMSGVCDSAEMDPLPVPNTDGSGGPDFLDLDADGDGLTDASESGALDADRDGLPDGFVDGNGDGLNDAGLTETPTDTDDDGAPDHLQLDADGDGIDDAIEGHDADMNGIADVMASGVDTDGNGIDDAFDVGCTADMPCGGVVGVGAAEQDTDMDGVPDYQDLDSDGDGIPDAIECGTMGPPMCSDSDMDGVPDYLEEDSDNDGIPDLVEAYDSDMDGTADTTPRTPSMLDTDGDGIDDAFDADCNAATPCPGGVDGVPPQLPDSDMDGMADYQDVDDDNDGILTATEVTDGATHGDDPDGDLIPAYLDLDSDGDGASDMTEGAADPTTDIDEDGVPDYLDPDAVVQDTDGDGIPDHIECPAPGDYVADPDSCRDTDGDGSPDFNDIDDDNDGILTADELVADTSEGDDLDGDGIPSYLDLDSDGDGATDLVEGGGTDGDGDGKVDECMDVAPEDGACDGEPLTPPNTDGNPDGADPYDTDADDDGILDITEAHDLDGDGMPDVVPSGDDTDMDGLDDAFDPDSGASGTQPPDRDGDGIPDFQDIDSDGDGIVDTIECGPLAPDCVDTDADGTPDYLDEDSDGDGISDLIEGNDANMDGVIDRAPSGIDTDGDGLDDAFDPDNGGTMAPTQDTDMDGKPDYQDVDSDGDGITDNAECEDAAMCPDTDADGTPDYLDLDSDGDGIPDATEGHDADGDGSPDSPPSGMDTDGDGLDDAYDPDNGGTSASLPDIDGDGTVDYRDDDDDDDGIPTMDEPGDFDGNGIPDYLEAAPDSVGGLAGGAPCSVGWGGSAPGAWLLGLGLMVFARRRRR